MRNGLGMHGMERRERLLERRAFRRGQARGAEGEVLGPSELLEGAGGRGEQQAVLRGRQVRHQPEDGVQLLAFTNETTMGVLALQRGQVETRPLPRAVHDVAEYLGFGRHAWCVDGTTKEAMSMDRAAGWYFRRMAGSTIGVLFKLATFGESHGPAIGGVIEGCPAGLRVDTAAVQGELDRRRPGSTALGTTRQESDRVEFLSGLMDGITLGTPIGFLIRNADARSEDYDHLRNAYRPGHADLTWERKFGIRDHRGGGRASARETAARVVGGAIARQLLAGAGMRVDAWVGQVGLERMSTPYAELDLDETYRNEVRCPDPAAAQRMAALIEQVREEGDTIGGRITCVARGVPVGLGEPVFDKLHADLGKALFSINAVKGVQFGSGFEAIGMRGSEHNDAYIRKEERIGTVTNRSGGIQGGISNGEDILVDLAFKPVSTIMRDRTGVDHAGDPILLEAKGRHDPCVVPRAVPIVEAMTCLVLADHWLRQRAARV